MADTVADFTEAGLIARIHERLPPAPAWMVVGIGDDAAVVEPERNRLEVLSVDALVEGVHFDRAFTPPAAVGHRALAVNLSDLAAMGAAPRLALLSLALPAALPIADFDQMISGLKQLAVRARTAGIEIFGATLTPFENETFLPGAWTPIREQTRQTVNEWVREGGAFDAVIDFDRALRDPEHPTSMLPIYDCGDHLHPSDLGYNKMGDAIDLSLFE